MTSADELAADNCRERADKCLELARLITDEHAVAALRNLAMIYQIKARRIEAGEES